MREIKISADLKRIAKEKQAEEENHYYGCWTEHPWCAISLLSSLYEDAMSRIAMKDQEIHHLLVSLNILERKVIGRNGDEKRIQPSGSDENPKRVE